MASQAQWRFLVVVGATMQYFVANGTLLNYNVLFVGLRQEFQNSAVFTGWVGALCLSLYCSIAPLSAVLGSRFGNFRLLLAGLGLESAGFLLTSFIPNLALGYLTFGLMSGFGAGFILFASSSLLLDWYSGHASCCRATGTPTLGGSIGVMVFGPLLNTTNASWGWRNSLRLLSGSVVLVGVLGALPLWKSPPEQPGAEAAMSSLPPGETEEKAGPEVGNSKDGGPTAHRAAGTGAQAHGGRPSRDEPEPEPEPEPKPEPDPGQDRGRAPCATLRQLALDPEMWLFILSITFGQLGWSFVIINFTSFMKGLLLSTDQISLVLLVFGAAGLGGKLLFVALGDRLPCLKLYALAATSVGGAVTAGFQLMAATFSHVIGLSVVWAIARGVMYASCLSAGDELFKAHGSDAVAAIVFVGFGLGVLIGSTITGALFDAFGNYRLSLYILVASFALSTVSMLLIPGRRRACAARRSSPVEVAAPPPVKSVGAPGVDDATPAEDGEGAAELRNCNSQS